MPDTEKRTMGLSAAGDPPAAEILYSDRSLAVAVKRSGVLSEAGDGREDSMPRRIAAALLRSAEEVYPVHRLDREAQGVMVYALTKAAAAALSRSVQNGAFEKTYLCLCQGAPGEKTGRWEDLLYHDRARNKTYTVRRMRGGVKRAALEYETLSTFRTEEGTELSLLRVRLLTGRTHQIRVQCAARGMPLAGDRKYGSALSGPLALWCFSLAFPHPESGEKRVFSLPPDGGKLAEAYLNKGEINKRKD